MTYGCLTPVWHARLENVQSERSVIGFRRIDGEAQKEDNGGHASFASDAGDSRAQLGT